MHSNKYFYYLLFTALFTPAIASAGLIFDVTENDRSLQLINYFFGDLSGIGVAYQMTVITVLSAQFLKFFVTVILLFSSYSIFQGVTQGAGEGSFFGKDISSFLTPIKMISGIGLLIPDASGYATIQKIFIWVILNGVGLANQLWSTIQLNASMGNSLTNNTTTVPDQVAQLTSSLFKIAAAINYMSTSSSYEMNSQLSAGYIDYTFVSTQTKAHLAQIPINLTVNQDLAARQVNALFPIILKMAQEQVMTYGTEHSFTWSSDNFSNDYAQSIRSTYEDLVYRTLYEQELMTNNASYYASITEESEGWISATVAYWDMYKGKSETQTSVSLNCSQGICDIGNGTLSNYLFIDSNMVNGLGNSLASSVSSYVNQLISNGAATSTYKNSSHASGKNIDMIQKLVNCMNYKDFMLDDFSEASLTQNMSRKYLTDFIDKNMYVIEFSIGLVQTILLQVLASLAVSGVMKSVSPLFYIMLQFVFGFIFLFLPILLSLVSTASVGSVYVILIPVIVFAAGAMGWFFKVIEAIFAAPLVALAIMTPSQDELGRAMHSLMTLITTALRPPLMIVGLVLSTKLVHVVLMLLGALFKFFYDSDFVDIGQFAEFFFNTMRYNTLTLITVSFIARAFGFINLLPDLVFKMIGLDSHEAQEADAFVEEMQSSCMQAAENLGGLLGMFNQVSQTGVSNLAHFKIKQG